MYTYCQHVQSNEFFFHALENNFQKMHSVAIVSGEDLANSISEKFPSGTYNSIKGA